MTLSEKKIEKGAFKEALEDIFEGIHFGNTYYDAKQPWKTRVDNIDECKATIAVCTYLIANIANLEKLITDESPLSPEKEITYKTVIRMLEEELASTKQELANYKKMVYGQKSEKSEIILEGGEQMSIFNETEENANKEVREREKDVIVPEHKRKSKRTHKETFADLPVEEVLHKVEDKACPECGAQIKKPLTATEKHEQRQERLKPVLDGLFAWLNEIPVSGGTKLARAVQYCLNEKQYLCRCLENGNIPVDNNRAENAIRPFVVGRKNWLFANSVKGAEASAVVYSLAATAVANGLNVEEYFTELCQMKQILPWKEVEA